MNRLIAPIRKILSQNTFISGVSTLVSGTIGAQALMILAAPALTRLYTPEDFGLLAVYTSLLSMSVVVASLRYELAIPLPKTDIEAANVVILSLVVVLIMTGLSTIIVFNFGDRIAHVLDAPGLAQYFWLLPAGVLFAGVYQVFNFWAVRTKSFSLMSKTTVYQAMVTLGVQFVGYSLGGVALLLGQAGGRGAGSLQLGSAAFKNKSFWHWNWAGVRYAAKRYKHFPMYSTWSSLLNVIGNQFPPLLFALFFSPAVAGWYLLTQRVLAMPVKLISDAVGKVFLSNAPESLRNKTLSILVLKIHTKLVYMIVPILIVFSVISPSLFSFIFGDEWAVSGEMARWLSPWLVLIFVLSPFMVLFEVLERQRLGVLFQLLMMTLRLGAIICGYASDSFMLSVQLFSAVSVASLLGFNLWVAWATKSNILEMFRTYVYATLSGALIIAPAVLFFSIPGGFLVKSIGVAFSVTISFIYFFKFISFVK